MIFSIFSAFGIQWLSRKQGVREDSAIAVFWSLGMAIGIVLTFLTPGYAPNLSEYLFGNILTITVSDIIALIVLSIVLVMFLCFSTMKLFQSHLTLNLHEQDVYLLSSLNIR